MPGSNSETMLVAADYKYTRVRERPPATQAAHDDASSLLRRQGLSPRKLLLSGFAVDLLFAVLDFRLDFL